jgi:hypothetical protein
VIAYPLPPATVMVLDAYLTQISFGAQVNVSQSIGYSNAFGQSVLNFPNSVLPSTLAVGQWVNFLTPAQAASAYYNGPAAILGITVGQTVTGLMFASLQSTGFISGASLNIPSFTTTAGSPIVTVTFDPVGAQAVGALFNIPLATTVGGLTLFGSYEILSVNAPFSFTINAGVAAGANQTVVMNGGNVAVEFQSTGTGSDGGDPIDRVLYPISRTEYASLPDKYVQGSPTTYWFERLTTPVINLWQPPDGNGPYTLNLWTQQAVQDVTNTYGQNLDMPPRFFEAACAEVAAHLAKKWKPELAQALTLDAKDAWTEAAAEDRERVPFYLTPMMESYWD